MKKFVLSAIIAFAATSVLQVQTLLTHEQQFFKSRAAAYKTSLDLAHC
jgi:hypothetical protein